MVARQLIVVYLVYERKEGYPFVRRDIAKLAGKLNKSCYSLKAEADFRSIQWTKVNPFA